MNIFNVFKTDKFLFKHLNYWGKVRNYSFYFSPAYENPEELIALLTDPAIVPETVFSTRRRRRVFAARTSGGNTAICKQFFLWQHKRDCFRLMNFAFKEITHQTNFVSLPFKVPETYGYYEKRILGFPVECGMFISYLEGFERLQPDDYRGLPEVFIKLFEYGIFHGDLSPKNILLNRKTNELALIDFGSYAPSPPCSLHHLVRMIGNFLYSTEFLFPGKLTDENIEEFILLLYQKLTEVKPGICDLQEFREIILKISKCVAWEVLPQKIFADHQLFQSDKNK